MLVLQPGAVCRAEPCDNPGYNSLQGLCSGGSQPFAGVCCNSVNGSTFAVYEIDRYNVMNETGVFAACTQNSDCDIYGTGYFCNYFAPNGSMFTGDSPAPKCSRPAEPDCFPIIPPTWNDTAEFACPPHCPL
jgi:hypothetical protein